MDTATLTQLLLFAGTVVTAVAGVWSIRVQTKQKGAKDEADGKLAEDAQRLEDIRELRDRIDKQDVRLENMGKKLDRVTRDLRSEQAMTHKMSLVMQTQDMFLDQVEEYFTIHIDALPHPIPRIPNRQHLKDLLALTSYRVRGDPET